jgi:hypothetical protein
MSILKFKIFLCFADYNTSVLGILLLSGALSKHTYGIIFPPTVSSFGLSCGESRKSAVSPETARRNSEKMA